MEPPSLILASKSPRRRALLEQIGVRFEVVEIDLNEAPEDYVLRLVMDKAQASRVQLSASLRPPVLGGRHGRSRRRPDLGQTEGSRRCGRYAAAARRTYPSGAERGRTGRRGGGTGAQRQRGPLPRDKRAGGGGLLGERWAPRQGRRLCLQSLGALFVAELRGSYSGMMGLPLFETAHLLAAAGIDCLSPRG